MLKLLPLVKLLPVLKLLPLVKLLPVLKLLPLVKLLPVLKLLIEDLNQYLCRNHCPHQHQQQHLLPQIEQDAKCDQPLWRNQPVRPAVLSHYLKDHATIDWELHPLILLQQQLQSLIKAHFESG
ncbi:MAG: hypothetical protein NTV32_00735 [Gammaproteobacteria bacterium]|nr:hypothetical protein [Gammaproteobacteria bacterium]